jgi:pantothenate kinase
MIDRSADGDIQSLTTAELTRRADQTAHPGRRKLLGITGPPGAGKSTLAAALQASVLSPAVLVPMDGFHRSKGDLEARGMLDRMGAPDTFDAVGFVELIATLRSEPGNAILAPAFDRDTESPVPDAIRIEPETRLVIVEGNYLLLSDEPWSALSDLLDEVWYVDIDDSVRLQRLVSRHIAYGKTPDAARKWSLGPDETNAELIAATRRRADLIVSLQK